MAENLYKTPRKRTPEQFWRWFRNINALGAVALAGAGAVLLQYQALLFTGAAINTVQAAGGEAMYQHQKKRR